MAARVRLYGVEAIFRKGRWQSSEPTVEQLLNIRLEDEVFAPAYPSAGNEAARRAERDLGAEVLELEEGESVPGRIY